MKKLLLAATLLLSSAALRSQAHCGERVNAFSADFTMQVQPSMTNGRINGSFNVGYSGSQKISVMVGYKLYDMSVDPVKKDYTKVFATPTATLLVKQRFNGEYSKFLHAVGVTAGDKGYVEVSYRLYLAPNSRSFATPGVLAAYNSKQGVMIGFVIMGLF